MFWWLPHQNKVQRDIYCCLHRPQWLHISYSDGRLALIEVESKNSWKCFLSTLKQDLQIQNTSAWSVMTDRQKVVIVIFFLNCLVMSEIKFVMFKGSCTSYCRWVPWLSEEWPHTGSWVAGPARSLSFALARRRWSSSPPDEVPIYYETALVHLLSRQADTCTEVGSGGPWCSAAAGTRSSRLWWPGERHRRSQRDQERRK